jgi:hypothetical protein
MQITDIKTQNTTHKDQISTSPDPPDPALKIWKSADPTTTNRKIASTTGPIVILSYFFYIAAKVHSISFSIDLMHGVSSSSISSIGRLAVLGV